MIHVIFNTAADSAVEIQNTKKNSAQVNNTTYLSTKKCLNMCYGQKP
jgi:hypothetical protein